MGIRRLCVAVILVNVVFAVVFVGVKVAVDVVVSEEAQAVVVAVLGCSWAVINRVISPLIRVITIVILLITPLITTHEPPSSTGREGMVSACTEACWPLDDIHPALP